MSEDYFSLGNDVVNLIAILDTNDDILSFSPMLGNVNGAILGMSTFPRVNDLTKFEKATVSLLTDVQFTPVAGAYGQVTASVNYALNSLNNGELEQQTNNFYQTVFPIASYSSEEESDELENYNCRGAHFIIYIDDIETDAVITPKIYGVDAESGEYYLILAGTALSDLGTYVLKVYPGIGQIPNASASDILPRDFLMIMEYSGTGTIDYSVGVTLML